MSNPEPSDVVGGRVRDVRKSQGLSVEELAERCAAVGLAHLTPNAIYLIEGGGRGRSGKRSRRRVTVEELLALSVALKVSPVVLLLPEDVLIDYWVTPETSMAPDQAFKWIAAKGAHPVLHQPSATEDEMEAAEARADLEYRRYLPVWMREDVQPDIRSLLAQQLREFERIIDEKVRQVANGGTTTPTPQRGPDT